MVEQVVDTSNILFLQEIMGDEFAELIQVFVRDAESRIEQMKQKITIGETEARAISDLAHGLKGSAMNLSAVALTECCKHLEMQAKQGDLENAKQLITEIEQEYQKVKIYLFNL